MSMEQLEILYRGTCPVCSADVVPAARLEESELLPCPECRTMLVVDGTAGDRLVLNEAPQIEEDWGE
jgi:lysine biosynthesis protein LysW